MGIIVISRTPENRGGGRLGRPEKKFGREIGGVGRKVRIGTDLPRDGQNLFGQALKNQKKIPSESQVTIWAKRGFRRCT